MSADRENTVADEDRADLPTADPTSTAEAASAPDAASTAEPVGAAEVASVADETAAGPNVAGQGTAAAAPEPPPAPATPATPATSAPPSPASPATPAGLATPAGSATPTDTATPAEPPQPTGKTSLPVETASREPTGPVGLPPRPAASPLPRGASGGPGAELFAGAPGTPGASERPSRADSTTSAGGPGRGDEPKLASWRQFAPEPPKPPTRLARVGRRLAPVGRFLTHEWTLACLGALALAVLITWPTLRDPAHTLPEDLGDPTLVAYLIAWGGHALLHDPSHLWHLNAFYPSPYGLAYSDSFLGYAPFAFFGTGPEAALVRYNIIYVLVLALAFVGMYALARQLGAGRIGAAVGGAAFALAPWRLGQAGHIHVISTGGIALALAMLARGHDVRFPRPRRDVDDEPARKRYRPGWALAGWLVAAWQITIGFGIGLVFAYVLLSIMIVGVIRWLVRRPGWPPVRLLLANGVGGLIFAGVAVAMALPYLRVLDLYPQARRTEELLAYFSPPLRGFVTSPPESAVWGTLHATSRQRLPFPAEMALLPGFALYALALAGVCFSIWSLRTRLLLLAGVVVSVYLALGTNAFADGEYGYLLLYRNLPGFDGLRTPGRLVVWTTLLMALLAAGAVTALGRQAAAVARRRGHPDLPGMARLALLIPLAFVLFEGQNNTPHPRMPDQPAVTRDVAGPVLFLPSTYLPDMHLMLWSTDHFEDMVNGTSGFTPTELSQIRDQTKSFPDAASVQYLRKIGVANVVVIPKLAEGSDWENPAALPTDGLGITKDVRPDGSVVFRLNP